jgi:hypothetical protein
LSELVIPGLQLILNLFVDFVIGGVFVQIGARLFEILVAALVIPGRELRRPGVGMSEKIDSGVIFCETLNHAVSCD